MGYSTVRMKSDRPRSERDFYPTPFRLADAAVDRLRSDECIGCYNSVSVLDAGCGTGVWGEASTQLVHASVEDNYYPWICGIDLQIDKLNLEKRVRFYDEVFEGDFLKSSCGGDYDVVLGNPPFSLAEEFIRRSMGLIRGEGYVYFLLRLAFLEGRKRQLGLFKEFPLKRCYVLTRRPSFFSTRAGRDTTDTLAYGMFLWQKGWTGQTELDWLYWKNK